MCEQLWNNPAGKNETETNNNACNSSHLSFCGPCQLCPSSHGSCSLSSHTSCGSPILCCGCQDFVRGTMAYFRICLPPLICASLAFSCACSHSQGVALLHRLSHAAGLFSPFTWLETIGGCYGPLRVLRPAGRDVEKHASLYTCGFLSEKKRKRRRIKRSTEEGPGGKSAKKQSQASSR